jgi:hypothetical protein
LLSDGKIKKDHLKAPNSNGVDRMPGPGCPGERHYGASLGNKCVPTVSWKDFPTPAEGVDFKAADFLPFLIGLQVSPF